VLSVKRDARGTLRAVASGGDARLESWQMMEIDRPRDAAQTLELMRRLHAALEDVRRASRISAHARTRARRSPTNSRAKLPVPPSHASEARALLTWMLDGHFVFLGYRTTTEARPARGRAGARHRFGTRHPARHGWPQAPRSIVFDRSPAQTGAPARPFWLLTKANTPSTVHRASYLDTSA